ncbi:unnamed protein product [Adineta ricciae]|uniref:TIR domain-containing protein n=1 Tax=Adineta ricciae TaxID=249248 RepID=A0A815TPA4_ADIRI|nr:unnamed protein product [Adineta ricciae]
MSQLQSKLDELTRLSESDYETNKTVTIFQYFDKIYTLTYSTSNFQTLIDALLQKEYAKLCYPILKRIHTDVFLTEHRWHISYYLIHSLWNYTDKSNAICTAVVDAQLVPMLIYNLNHENYLRNFSSNDAIKKLFDMIVSILHNIAQVPELVNHLRQHQCLEALNRLIPIVGSHNIFLRGISYLTLAYIIREDERIYLTNSNESIPYLVDLLSRAVTNHERRSNGLETRELCKGLSKLSVADNNKHKISAEGKLLDSLLNMLEQHTNTQEQISACILIWSLAFDPNVRKVYHDHKRLNEILHNIAQTASNDELRRSASGCLCTLMGGPKPPASKASPTEKTDRNVMISYNHDNKQLSKQIKEHLVADGYNVWIDLEKMHGNLLDAMSDAIENSSIFLMCYTEKYKDSPSCRLECEYAYQRKKHIVPLLFQPNYKPDGWLGIIVGTRVYVNFAKKPFETAYSETLSELQALNTRTEKKPTISPPNKPAPPPPEPPRSAPTQTAAATAVANETLASRTSPPPNTLVHLMSQFRMDKASEPMPISVTTLEKMSLKDTQHLLGEHGLDKFLPMFVDIDGPKLLKLFEIKHKAPQCYYMLIKEKLDQMPQEAKDRSHISTFNTPKSTTTAPTMAQFLQLMLALDKLADRCAFK